MIVSTNQDNDGYHCWKSLTDAGKRVFVYLNGEKQQHVSVADDLNGYVRRCVIDDDGNIQIDPSDPERVLIWEETVYGDVRIEILEPANDDHGSSHQG